MNQIHGWLRAQAQRSPRLYALMRRAKRRLGRAVDGPLPPDAFRARLEIQGPVPTMEVAAHGTVSVDVTNLSRHPWPGGGNIALSYQWRRGDGSVWGIGRAPLAMAIEPGRTARVECPLRTPNTPATYTLEMDLAYGEALFGRAGSEPLRRDIVVSGLDPEAQAEVDYEAVYLAADLAKDHWSVAGPGTEEEFTQLGRAELRMLQDLGLRPDSRVLDVGCGTGNLAGQMLGFLGGDGIYYGTDLSDVAVRFCREKYARPNFTFARNDMTTLPIEGLQFDFVVFFSVFTHTYPAETRALLAEAARLLSDEGIILANSFEGEIEGDSVGTRALVVLDRRRMPDMAEALGLEARTVSQYDWNPTAQRRIDLVMRRFEKRGRKHRPASQ